MKRKQNTHEHLTKQRVYAAYSLWMSYGFAGEKGMKKLGDRFSYRGGRFDLLASDRDLVTNDGNRHYQSTHQDDAGVLNPWVMHNETHEDLVSVAASANTKFTISAWTNTGTLRGLMDNNYASSDGAVRRIVGVADAFGATQTEGEQRVQLVPEYQDDAGPQYRVQIPTADGSRVVATP